MGNKAIAIGEPVKHSLPFDTLAQMLLYVAKEYPNRGITYVDTSGQEQFESYAQLAADAKGYLLQLYTKGIKPGDIVMLELDQPREFYKVLWACFLGGIIAAPITQPTSWEPKSPGLLKFSRVWEVLDQPVVIIEQSAEARYEKLRQHEQYASLQLLTNIELQQAPTKKLELELELHNSQPEDIVFLQFSSGSTGTPKGVQLTNENIMANNYATMIALGVEHGDTAFTWLPHTHDMGLFGQHLLPMYTASNIVQFLPYSFIRSPFLFLKKITEHRGNWFCCTNFGFDWMVQKIPQDKLDGLDLSSLRITLNGAEPISTKVIEQFITKFSACGYRAEMMFPAYGMAEATVGVSAATVGHRPIVEKLNRAALVNGGTVDKNIDNVGLDQITEFVREGRPMPGIEIRIADNNGELLDECCIGEIQLRGASVTKGYYNLPEINEQLFHDGWLKTGDLGYIVDGELVVTGRMKDIVFVRGLNYYAHDLEEVLYETDIIPRGNLAVVGHFSSKLQKEEVLVFVKYKAEAAQFSQVKQVLTSHLQQSLAIEITHVLPIKTIPKTTSGKVQRYLLQNSYEQGDFDDEIMKLARYEKGQKALQRIITEPRNSMEMALRKMWSAVLSLPEEQISIDDTFTSLGGQSIKAYQLLESISLYVQREVGAELLVLCKTIEEMASFIEQLEGAKHRKERIAQYEITGESLDIHTAIAITGLSIRVADAASKEQFWDNLVNKVDSIKAASEHRIKLSDSEEWSGWLGELENIELFDHEFFEITDEEAAFMDPQQRIAYEVSYEALEEAGMMSQSEEPRPIGVYAAVNPSSYMNLLNKRVKHNMETIHPHAMVGNMSNIVAAKIAHLYNFTGPALAIDTACSSYLVAMHHAVQAVRSGEIEGAVVVGANINVTPEVHQLSKRAGICSSSPHTKVFDKNADGSIIGEGVIVAYIEPLTLAVRENKHIHGVIRGTAINNDGYSLSIMAPNPKGQYEVLKKAYRDANVLPAQVSYVEAHGSGTTIGDPIEINALNKWFGGGHTEHGHRIGIGSVKSNIGHLFPASSGASFAKVLLALQHKTLAPSLHVNEINPALQLEKTPFYVVKDTSEWIKKEETKRIAGIHSLGLGGTNAHLVLEEWEQPVLSLSREKVQLVTFSAKSEISLQRLVDLNLHAVQKNGQWSIGDIAYTRNRGRRHYAYRAACLVEQLEDGSCKWSQPQYGLAINKLNIRVGALVGMPPQYANVVAAHSGNPQHAQDKLDGSDSSSIGTALELIAMLQSVVDKPVKLIINAGEATLEETVDRDIIIAIHVGEEERAKYQHDNKLVIDIKVDEQMPAQQQLLNLVQQLYVLGVAINWSALHPKDSGRLLPLPAYCFNHKASWIL